MSYHKSLSVPPPNAQVDAVEQRGRIWLYPFGYTFMWLCLLILVTGSFLISSPRAGMWSGSIDKADMVSPEIYKSSLRAILYGFLSSNYADVNTPDADVPRPRESNSPSPDKVISCYYNTPQNNQSGQLQPSNINPHLCTHINIAFAQIVNKEIYLDDDQKMAIQGILKLKNLNPKLKILLSVGGAGNQNGFSDMVIDHASRKIFIKSIKNVLRTFKLDGIDLDWEFPAVQCCKTNRAKNRERQHFSQLLREIRAEYIRERRSYLLTIAAAAPESIVDTAYDIDQINLYTDFVNIMTYDFHSYTVYTPFTGLNSPIYSRSEEKFYLSTLNINYTCNMFMRKGLDRNKIVIGIPTYGHSFYLVNTDNTNIGSPASTYGKLGSRGFVDYSVICIYQIYYNSMINYKEDKDAQVPYLYMGHDWISYDDPESVKKKVQFVKDNNLLGAMVFSLNADDYLGYCDFHGGWQKKFPLLHSVRDALLTDMN